MEVLVLFILGMGAVIVALVIYMIEVNQSLKAIGLELNGERGQGSVESQHVRL